MREEEVVMHKEVGSGLVLTLIWVDGPCAYIVRSLVLDSSGRKFSSADLLLD